MRNRLPTLLLILTVCGSTRAGDWPGWRGPLGNGVCDEQELPPRWSATENVRWRTPLPDRGNSTPVVWGDRVFVTQAVETTHRRTLLCFDRRDGRRLWESGVTYAEPEPTNGQNPYCSASPATDGNVVVAYFGSAGLYAYDMDGKELWHRDVGRVDSWQGSGSSPIIWDGLCVLNAGPGTHAVLIACDVRTGDVAWKATPPAVPGRQVAGGSRKTSGGFDGAINQADPTGEGGYLGSWSTPVVLRQGDHEELIVVHPSRVCGYEPRTGREIWRCDGLPQQSFASPAIGEGILVASSHRTEGGGTRVTAVKLGGQGDVTASHRLWQVDLPKECVGSGVVAAGHVFLPTQFGSLVCLELSSGRKVWEKRLNGEGTLSGSWSSIVLCDGKLLIPNQSGETFVVAASPEFELLSTHWVGQETTCASLAVAHGNVFLRTYKALWCLGPNAL